MRKLVSLLVVSLALPAAAATRELKTDSFNDGGEVRAQGQYASGEKFAIELSADPDDYPIRVTTVRALFIPTFAGGDGQVAPFHLTIYAGTGAVSPGAVLFDQADDFQITASTSSYNEIVLPTPIDVASGSIRVSFSPTLDQTDSGVTIGQDAGPIQPTRNFIFTGGAWNAAASLGLTGNYVIRAMAETQFGGGGSPPVVTSVSPATVEEGASTRLTISGSGFEVGATARVGSTPLTGIQVPGSSSLSGLLPEGLDVGTYDVIVRNPDGEEGTLANGLTIVPAGGGGGSGGGGGPEDVRLDSIVPGVAPAGEEVGFVLFGARFAAGATVTIGGAEATAVGVVSSELLRGTAPAGLPVGGHDVTVAVPGAGEDTLSDAFVVVAGGGGGLAVDRVVPPVVAFGDAAELVVLGAGFAPGMSISVGGMPLGEPVLLGQTAVAGFAPPLAPGVHDVVISYEDGRTASRAGALEVTFDPFAGPTADAGGGGASEDDGCGCAGGTGAPGAVGLALGLVALARLGRKRSTRA